MASLPSTPAVKLVRVATGGDISAELACLIDRVGGCPSRSEEKVSMRNVLLVIFGVITATVAAIAVPAAASVSTNGPSPSIATRSLREAFGMTAVPTVRILGATPHKPGNFTVLSANGEQAIVPDFLKSRVESHMKQDRVQPLLKDTVYGDCGSSFINITTKSNGFMVFRSTGFSSSTF